MTKILIAVRDGALLVICHDRCFPFLSAELVLYSDRRFVSHFSHAKFIYILYSPSRSSILILSVMPPRRSHTRELIDHLKSEPYHIGIHNRIKVSHPRNGAKIDELLNRKITPPQKVILRALVEVTEAVMNENDEVRREKSQMHSLHIFGDILYKCLSPVRKHIFEKTKQRTSEFIKSWNKKGIDDDTTEEAKVLGEFVMKAKQKACDPCYFRTHFDRYKTWLQMYAKRCHLVHGGFDDMTSQEIWNSLKKMEVEVNSGVADFPDAKEKKYALQAISEMRNFKFNWKNNRWEDKEGNTMKT